MDKVVDNCEKEANAHKVESVGRCIHEKMVNFDRVREYCGKNLCPRWVQTVCFMRVNFCAL